MFLIVFNALLSPWLVLALLAPLSLFLWWIEWRRKHRFLTARVFAVLVFILSLAGILLRPSVETTATRHIMLLTPGYNTTTVDSLLAAHRGLQVKHAPGTTPYKRSTALRAYRDLVDGAVPVQFVVGEGLPPAVLDFAGRQPFTFLPPAPKGITALEVSKATAHQPVVINGTFEGDGAGHTITIAGPGGPEDSVRVDGRGSIPFSLNVTPRQAGNFLYVVQVQDGNTISREALPVHVAPFEPLKILFLEPYPTFEAQYLKNYLAAKGHAVVLRYELSKNVFRYEYANHPQVTVSRLTPDVLARFDVVVAEADVLQKIPAAEKRALADGIAQGLGYFTLGPLEPGERAVAGLFPFETVPVKNDTAHLFLQGKQRPMPALRWRVKDAAGAEALLRNERGVLTAVSPAGAGHIGVQVLQDTYRLTLAGDSSAYSALWAPLIQNIARTKARESTINVKNPLPIYPDEPVQLQMVSAQPNPALHVDSVAIPLREDVLLDGVWHATAWAGKAGWHTVAGSGAETVYYFVGEKGSWPTLRREALRVANTRAASTAAAGQESITVMQPVSPLWFFVLFVLAAGFIWLSPKL